MKKIIAMLLSFVMLVSFAGCGDETNSEKTSESKPVKTVTVPYKTDYPYLYLREDMSGWDNYDYEFVDYVSNDNKAFTNSKEIASSVKEIFHMYDGDGGDSLIVLFDNGTVKRIFDDGTVEDTNLSNIAQISGYADFYQDYTSYDALKTDGTIATEDYIVSDWTDLIAISKSKNHIVGLKSDGTVVAYGENSDNQCNVEEWKDIVAIYAVYQSWDSSGTSYTFGIKSDGTIVHTVPDSGTWCRSYNTDMELDSWTDIISLSISDNFAMGLKSDGTVVTCGKDYYGETKTSSWTDIAAIKAFNSISVGIKKDGTVVSAGDNYIIRTQLKDKKLKLD